MSQSRSQKSPPGRRGKPLVPAVRDRLKKIVVEFGEREASQRLGLTRHTLARALGGLGIYPPTAFLIERRVAEAPGSTEHSETSSATSSTR